MKPISTLGHEIYISLSIRQLRLRDNKEVGIAVAGTGGVLVDASWLVLRAGIRRRAKRRICKQPRYTHRSPRIKRLSREAIREQLAQMIHGG